jgi:chemotaxis signal transduction protein
MTAPATSGRLVRLTAGHVAVALPVERVLGVERGERVSRPDNTLTTPLGVFRVLPLAELLEGANGPLPPRGGQVVLTEVAGERIGLWVEEVAEVAETPRLAPAPTVLHAGGRFLTVALPDDGPLPVLDLDRLFDPADEPTVVTASQTNTVPAVTTTGRLIVAGQFEHPGPGGRVVGFGLPSGCVDDVTDLPRVSSVPAAPTHVLGLVEWNGRAVPKVNLAAWCGLTLPPPESARVVIARVGGERVAVAAGAKVRAIAADAPHTDARLPLPVRPDRTRGVFEFAGITIVIPNLTGITA